jgi:spoIIIJ-associated protein
MTEKRASLEIIAPSVEEAIERGLEELGLEEDGVEVEVLDAGSRGLFGLGSRQARVRLTVLGGSLENGDQAAPVPTLEVASPAVEAWEEEALEEALEEAPATPQPAVKRAPKGSAAVVVKDEVVLHVARETVVDLLERMRVRATVTAHMGTPAEDETNAPVMVDVRGSDLSILIGPRAETLNALQYIAALIVSKELGYNIPLVVDVEGYRSRRERQLRQLARRMADQAVKTNRRQMLEPMSASERRIIHIELRNHPEVTTESIGEEPHRKVTILPKS